MLAYTISLLVSVCRGLGCTRITLEGAGPVAALDQLSGSASCAYIYRDGQRIARAAIDLGGVRIEAIDRRPATATELAELRPEDIAIPLPIHDEIQEVRHAVRA